MQQVCTEQPSVPQLMLIIRHVSHQVCKSPCSDICCREDLQVGEEVQIMPCNSNHVYHPDCLAPWLKAHNSCPVCRFELPTDDMAYETKKERDQREAEDSKGAANAVSHTDFLYT